MAAAFFDAVRNRAAAAGLLSEQHHGRWTQLEAWRASRAYAARCGPEWAADDPGNPTVDFRGERRWNAPHVSTTEPDAQLDKKADVQKSVMAYFGHVLMDNRTD